MEKQIMMFAIILSAWEKGNKDNKKSIVWIKKFEIDKTSEKNHY